MVDTADIEHVAQPQEVVGVDLGIAALVTPSRGKPILVPKEHMILIKKVAQVVGRREPEAKRLPQSRQG
jgi:transposase